MNTGSSIEAWVPYRRPSPQAQLRLFCFPHAGGAASSFRSWPEALLPEIEVCALQFPGRETRLAEQPINRLSLLLQELERVLVPHFESPFAFLGHSLGALICFEFARLLRRRHGLEPLMLFVSGSRAPHKPNRLPLLHDLPDTGFVQGLRRLNCTAEEVLQNEELLDVFLPALRADFAIFENYTYSTDTPLDSAICVLGGLQDSLVDQEELAAWRQQTQDSCTVRMFPGDHLFLFDAWPLVSQVITEEMAGRLAKLALNPP